MTTTSLAERVEMARKKAALSCRQLDLNAGLTVGHSALIEDGKKENITLETLKKLSRALGVSIGWLSGEEEHGGPTDDTDPAPDSGTTADGRPVALATPEAQGAAVFGPERRAAGGER